MRADDGQQAVAFQEFTDGFVGVEVGATAHVVMHETLWTYLLPEILDRI